MTDPIRMSSKGLPGDFSTSSPESIRPIDNLPDIFVLNPQEERFLFSMGRYKRKPPLLSNRSPIVRRAA